MPDQLSPMLWEDNGYLFTSDGDQNDIINFNLGFHMGVEILGIRHVTGVQAMPDDTIMAMLVEVTLDLGATQVSAGAISATTFENSQAIWQDLVSVVDNFTTSGAAAVRNGPVATDWEPKEPIILAQNLNVVVSFSESLSGVMYGNIRVWFRYISLSDLDLVRLLARGRLR